MKKDKDIERLSDLLQEGLIGFSEFDSLMEKKKRGEPINLDKLEKEIEQSQAAETHNVTSFVLTLFAMIVVLIGVCFVNVSIPPSEKIDGLPTGALILIWSLILLPIIGFGIRAIKTNDKGMGKAVILLIFIILYVIALKYFAVK